MALSSACVYINNGAERERDVEDTLRSMRQSGIRGCIVVDECPPHLHSKLETIVSGAKSNLSLLTLDYDPEGDPRSDICLFHRLLPYSDEEMETIVESTFPKLKENTSKIASFSQGFPRMAELLVQAILRDEPQLWDLAPREVFKRLVIRRSDYTKEVYETAKALSVLEHVGVGGDAEDQLEVFAEHICRGREPEAVYERIRELEDAGIAYRRGDYVRVTPLPLAIVLASEWWSTCTETRARSILVGGALPTMMVGAVLRQLRRLDGHPFVKKLVARIMGPDSPFRQRDLLNSASGSRLVNSLAEINPEAVATALTATLSGLSLEDARQIRAGRRDLVRCLEKLSWWPQTFHDAAWLLLLFGAAENEDWANNATRQFKRKPLATPM